MSQFAVVAEPGLAPERATAPRVLIADDDATTRLVLSESLREAGFEVVETRDGEEALERLANELIDVVLLDVVMPGIDGYRACRTIRQTHVPSDVPVLIMTSRSDMRSVGEAFDAGATDFINKPINFDVLPHRLRFLLRSFRTQQELREARVSLAEARETARLGSFLVDLDEDVLVASAEAEALLGLPAPTVPMEEVAGRFHPNDVARVRDALDQARGGRPFEVEARLLASGGIERLVGLRGQPLERSPHERSPKVTGTVQDLTEQNQSRRRQLQLSVLGHTVSLIAGTGDLDSLAVDTLRNLVDALGVDGAHLLLFENEEPRPSVSVVRAGDGRVQASSDGATALSARERALAEKAHRHLEVATQLHDGKVDVAVPMLVSDRVCGGVLVNGLVSRSTSDRAEELAFLQTVATHLAVALERARDVAKEQSWRRSEELKLRAEVERLRRLEGEVELVYGSRTMEELLEVVRRVGPTDATVLVTGESGTGKELVARATHNHSTRASGPLVVVDCASIPATLLESELFGHEKGAYTGAASRKAGRLAEADGGSVFLDEIGELPLELQSKLLRFVQEKYVVPVGGHRAQKVDARVIAATNRDLAQEVQEGRFREDLYYRLNVVRLHVPPLRDRNEDAMLLAEHFARRYSLHYDKDAVRYFPKETIESILAHRWPGNVRELQNRVMRAVILSTHEALTVSDLELSPAGERASLAPAPTPVEPADAPVEDTWSPLWASVEETLGEAVRAGGAMPPIGRWMADDLLQLADQKVGGVCTRGAKLLGLPEATFRRRLARAKRRAARPPTWSRVEEALVRLIDAPTHDLPSGLFDAVRAELMSRTLAFDARVAAELMAVSLPTYRRWRKKGIGIESTSPQQESAGPSSIRSATSSI